MKAILSEFQQTLVSVMSTAQEAAQAWEQLKTVVRTTTLRTIKQRRRTLRATYKQNLKRLVKREERLRELARDTPLTVDALTDLFDDLTIVDEPGMTPLQRAHNAINDCIRDHNGKRQRRLFRAASHNTGKTTKAFFSRVSTKYADNTIHRLDPVDGCTQRGVHEKADTLADAWEPIFQQVAPTENTLEEVLGWLGETGEYAARFADLDEPIYEAEVRSAISLMRSGKACGPATRTRLKLELLIHPNQAGFVPGRTIHDTIDLFTAAQYMANVDPSMQEVLALLLDVRKAYDSVNRSFLYATLVRLGFPPHYVTAVCVLHEGTNVTFLSNGSSSRRIRVTSGIRQECPLAPLLFLFVLEALYRRIHHSDGIRGIILRSGQKTITLKGAGFADDTACYVRTAAEVQELMAITRFYAQASGLTLNEAKTVILTLNVDWKRELVQMPTRLTLQDEDTTDRYLGTQVGRRCNMDQVWKLAQQQLRVRLRLALHKTMTVDQRDRLASAIIIPKLMFIGRHAWPSSAMVVSMQRFIYNFVWHGQFTDGRVLGRPWLRKDVVALSRRRCGIAIPVLELELKALAASTVHKWAMHSTPTALMFFFKRLASTMQPTLSYLRSDRPWHPLGVSTGTPSG
ncbi:hypothetical protein PR003_g12127 [Phytophthora rubi]|uniref:Reverse transcriptase domain-containing protein n=1 Tax=Phytophthora rubi TaxID=129364 RepID=A0A6A4FDJ4_9STRA|nr:hypothetical protein PR003_g12127 [Phytophthora rubi]